MSCLCGRSCFSRLTDTNTTTSTHDDGHNLKAVLSPSYTPSWLGPLSLGRASQRFWHGPQARTLSPGPGLHWMYLVVLSQNAALLTPRAAHAPSPRACACCACMLLSADSPLQCRRVNIPLPVASSITHVCTGVRFGSPATLFTLYSPATYMIDILPLSLRVPCPAAALDPALGSCQSLHQALPPILGPLAKLDLTLISRQLLDLEWTLV